MAQRAAWLTLIVVTLYICFFSNLSVIGFVGPDEPRYAWIARDMAESGDWVTPRLYGRPWFEKPPLLYWGGAIFFKLLGEGHPEVAARLPSAISALLATLALAWLAWRTYGEECARWLLLLLPTSVGMIGFSHACATDMPFAGMLTIAMVCAAVVLGLTSSNEDTPILRHTPWTALFSFGFFLGLAGLAKGPAGIILCGGAVFFWAVFTKRWHDALRLLHPATIGAFCITALPWYILCARRNPDFFRIFFIEHNFKRYLTPEFQHIQPFWFYIPVVVTALFPWVTGAIAINMLSHGRAAWTSRIRIFALCWCVWPLLFFSFSQSKLPGYILPAIPPAIFWAVSGLVDSRSEQTRARRIFAIATGLTLMLSAVAFVAFESKVPNVGDLGSDLWHQIIYVSLFVGGIVCTVYARKDRFTLAVHCSAATLLLSLLGLYLGLYSVDGWYSARRGAREAVRLYSTFQPSSAAVHRQPRGIEFGLDFYLRRELPTWSNDPSAEWVFTARKSIAEAELAGFTCPRYVFVGAIPAAIPCQRVLSLGGVGGGRKPE